MSMPRILIVEDEPVVAMSLRRHLTTWGYHVVGQAVRGEQAVVLAKEFEPDLVLMDIQLVGDIDGIEAASQIRAQSDAAVIFLTGYSDSKMFARARITEPYGYLIKPVLPKDLLHTIETALQRRAREKRLREDEQRLRALLKESEAGYCLLNRDGKFLEVNAAWLRMHGYESPDDVIGQDWSTSLFHEDLEKFKQILDTAQAGTGVFGQEFRRTRKDGSIAYQTLSCKPIWHGGGLAGVECFLIDGVEPRSATPEQIEWSPRLLIVEDEALAARHLKMSLTAMGYQVAGVVNSGEEAMDAARETLPDLVLMDIMLDGEMDGVETAALIRSEMDIPVVYLTAYTDERLMERAKLTEPLGYLVKPFREEAVRATLEMALHRYTSEKGFRGELRNQVQQRTAELLTLNENLRREILERERAEQALRESRELYYTLFEQSLDPIAITTPKGDFIDANSSFIDLVGYTREELMQINAKALWSVPEDRTNWENKMAERGFSREYEWRCCRKDGSVRECLLNSTVRWTEDGTVQYQSVCRDVTERRRMEIERERLISELTAAKDALQFEATHDGLTSIWNRAEILRKIHVELTRCQREGLALGIIMIDVDHFKRINDEHGHLAGDAVLRQVAVRVKSLIRPYDMVGRYGGEEFILVLPSGYHEAAKAVAERVRWSFVHDAVKTAEGVFNITVSCGVKVVEKGHVADLDAIIRAADEALYRAKRNGRNRVEVA